VERAPSTLRRNNRFGSVKLDSEFRLRRIELYSAQQYLAALGAAEPPHAPTGNRARRAKDLADLAAGLETGWWDGRPAPWPDDFLDDASDWRIGGSDHPPIPLTPGQPPF